jgi:hypothetical protein
VYFHATAAANRASIQAHGLDWRRMGEAPGIAGSPVPEAEGIFLFEELEEATFFVEMAELKGDGPFDIWEVSLPDGARLEDGDAGFLYTPDSIPPDRLRLLP